MSKTNKDIIIYQKQYNEQTTTEEDGVEMNKKADCLAGTTWNEFRLFFGIYLILFIILIILILGVSLGWWQYK